MRFVDLIGTTVGDRYRLNALIGRGGVSAIFEGIDIEDGRKIAVKVMTDAKGDTINRQRFEREAQLVSRMDHPNICRIYHYWHDDEGVPYMAMELIEGKTLATLTEDYEPLEFERAIAITEDICLGLDYAHKMGVVHRDLKPENIMIENPDSTEETVKILDFGLAKNPRDTSMEKLTQTGWVPDTPGFMSPEQIMGKELDGRSDLYSLACVFYLMLTGKEVFEHKNPLEVMRRHAKDEPVLDPALPSSLIPFFTIALEKSPEKRFENAGEFSQAIAAATKV